MHYSRKRLLRRGLEFHVCTLNQSAHTKKSGNLFDAPRIYMCVCVRVCVCVISYIYIFIGILFIFYVRVTCIHIYVGVCTNNIYIHICIAKFPG